MAIERDTMEKKQGRPKGSKNAPKMEVQKIQKPTCPSCSSTDNTRLRSESSRNWIQDTPFGDVASKSTISVRECKECQRQWKVQTWYHDRDVIAQTQEKK